jgi:gliding motility-associated-like protein
MIANANENTYLATASALGNVYYYCVVSSTVSGCTSPQSSGIFQISTIAQPLITSEAYQTGSCLNNALQPLQIFGNQDSIASYRFFKSNSNWNYDGAEIALFPYAPEDDISGLYTYYFTYGLDYPYCISDTSDFYEVTITDTPQITLQNTNNIIGCSGAEFNLGNLVQSNIQENFSIIWSMDNTIVDTIANSTNYQTLPIFAGSHQFQAEIISSFDNCNVSDSVILNLNVAPTPFIAEELNFDQNICPYETEINIPSVVLSNDYSLITPIFEWFDSSDNTITPIAFANTNSYLPPIQNNSNYQSFCQINFGLPGCPTLETSISEISIDYMNDQCFPFLNIPEAISPNNDGINDYWTINEIELFNGYAINIFNSFGQSIYQIKNTPPNWDGTWNGQALPNGDYFYSVKLDELNRTLFGTISIAK